MGVKVIRPSGRKDWYIQVCEGGKRFLRHVGSREAAYKAKKEIEGALAAGVFVKPDPEREREITLKEYAEKWMAGHVAANLKPATARYYRMNLDAHLLPALGGQRLADLTREA